MSKPKKICIVDDDAIVVFGLKRALLALGRTPEFCTFENGLDALEAFKQWLTAGEELPSPIFIDLHMPVMDGWDLVRELSLLLASKKGMASIYIMTSSIDVRDIERAKIYGLETNYLVKPVATEDLERILA